jgi:vancomycin resistance protein YoaR
MQTTLSTPRYRPLVERRTSADFLLIWLGVALLVIVALFAGWQFWHTDRIFTGTRVAGVPVGGLTRAQALIRLNQDLTPYPLPPVTLYTEDQRWVLSSAQVTPSVDWMDAINAAYLVGRRGNFGERMLTQISAFAGRRNLTPALHLDEGAIRQQISQIAAEVRRPGRAAVQIGSLSLPSQPGVDVDVSSTTALALTALRGQEVAAISIQTVPVTPPDGASIAAPSTVELSRPPLTLRDGESGLIFAIDTAILSTILPADDVSRLDEGALRSVVEGWAGQIEIPAQDARLRFNTANGQVEVIQPSLVGRRLDVDATVANIREALVTNQSQIRLPLVKVAPKVDASRISEMGIRELVAAGTSYYRGSSTARIRNIEVAAEKFVGVVIPPGEVFSFNKTVQDVSAANGFEDSAIIWGDQTMVGVGGGVCQVSTTVFRAALNAGFPIVERYNHGYVVSWYGEPGMDATIYTPTVDFRFRNDTGSHLLIQPAVDSVNGVITFNFYGTKPDRQVTIGQPVISDVKEPGEPVFRVDESLAAGQRRQVEYAQRGMTVTVERTVTENGQSRVDKIVSQYQPWNAVFLVGPGTEIPATPTP